MYANGGYVRDYEVIAICTGYSEGTAVLEQRNRFFRGDTADVLEPQGIPYLLPMEELFDAEGNELENANHAQMKVLLRTEHPVAPGAIFRKRINSSSTN